MIRPPPYFEVIRQKAQMRWEQLENDPELAGPWHQLFKQVQSPRHVLSELLQNADDAGATEASVRFEEQVFIFEHNGEDFSEEHFASLCRFGYSNKRALHTIGFRGVGFKSTFSLGDCVELFTPTLCVSFDCRRFTEPRWGHRFIDTCRKTQVRVAMSERYRQKELEKNLQEWRESPVSLLFFRHIRRLIIGRSCLEWHHLDPGPVRNSEWMSLIGSEDKAVLLIRSQPEKFPEEALNEIRQERLLSDDDAFEYPPSTIDLVLGSPGRLFVVLPTGVETQLPFACNAPFIQDPARLKIKDPETSPTNRWLLDRAGKLAASSTLCWLNRTSSPVLDRAQAFGFFPDVDQQDNTLHGLCGATVENAFVEAIEGERFLLTDAGELKPKKEAVIIPAPILDVWPGDQATTVLDERARAPLSRHISRNDQKKLINLDFVEEISDQKLLQILKSKHLPKPATWEQMLKLWIYVAPEVTNYRVFRFTGHKVEDLCILPVQGHGVLYAPKEVVRLGERKVLKSEDDWEFLASYLIVLDQDWLRYLADQRRIADAREDATLRTNIEAALGMLKEIALHETSDASRVIEGVATKFFSQSQLSLKKAIQLAQVAAKLGATVGNSFRFASHDRHLRSLYDELVFDEHGALEELIPTQERAATLLHPEYGEQFTSCSREEWLSWVFSGRSSLRPYLSLQQKNHGIWGRAKFEETIRARGFAGQPSYHYVTEQFLIVDWDFDEVYWKHWTELAKSDPSVWAQVTSRCLLGHEANWTRAINAKSYHIATTGNQRLATDKPLVPSWAIRLRNLACLPDTRGVNRMPSELLRRTPSTESLMDVESFVHGVLDTESSRPLLDLLGVRSAPMGPESLLACLRALAQAPEPPSQEVDKWYRRLDQMLGFSSTVEFHKIKEAFVTEKIILAHDGAWVTAAGVFLKSDEEDAPGAALIRPTVNDLMLWSKIGVAERPTAELTIKWLQGLPSGQALSAEDVRRVRAVLARYPDRIWQECGHWLSLAGVWSPVGDFEYSLTLQPLIQWKHLHPWVKQKTADMQRLPSDVTGRPPFSQIPLLAARIEERFPQNPLLTDRATIKEWLTTLGADLKRVQAETEEETLRIRQAAQLLARTKWQPTPGLETITFVGGQPAGTPRKAEVIWVADTLYVDNLPVAKLARRVPEEINKAFARPDIKAALDYSFERSAKDVHDYVQENFELSPAELLNAATGQTVIQETGGGALDEAIQLKSEAGPEPLAILEDVVVVSQTPLSEDEVVGGGRNDSEIEAVSRAAGEADSQRNQAARPPKSSIIDRFASFHGYHKNGDGRFVHGDGSWIGRANGSPPFPWERWTASGNLVCSYWPKDHCLLRSPLELPAEVWWLMERDPEAHSLILADHEGNPIEMSGPLIHEMNERNELILHPASYRLEQTSQ